eukprot:12091107-Heterocapsa_arctica.AAC.1
MELVIQIKKKGNVLKRQASNRWEYHKATHQVHSKLCTEQSYSYGEKLATFMKDKPKTRMSRSRLEALPTMRKKDLGIGHYQESLGTYYTLMEQTKNNIGTHQCGYIIFEDFNHKEYASKLDEKVKLAE